MVSGLAGEGTDTCAEAIAARKAREPSDQAPVSTPRGRMSTKPILFWPKPRSDIALHLDRDGDDFLVADTNSVYELQKLYNIRRDTPIFDPFPEHGKHYRDFAEHVVACDCRYHIVGINACQDVLQALKDPSLAHSTIEEILAAIKPAESSLHQRTVIDWQYLNLANTSVLVILVFVGIMIGDVVSPQNSLLAAITATSLFALMYVCVRANVAKLFSFMTGWLHVGGKSAVNGKTSP